MAMLSGSSTTLVQTELSQQLLDRLTLTYSPIPLKMNYNDFSSSAIISSKPFFMAKTLVYDHILAKHDISLAVPHNDIPSAVLGKHYTC